jgi:hypothetical protein
MHFVDLLVVATIFDDIMIPEVQPRDCRKEWTGNFVEWMEEAPIANDAEENSLSSIECPRHQESKIHRHGDQCEPDWNSGGKYECVQLREGGKVRVESKGGRTPP